MRLVRSFWMIGAALTSVAGLALLPSAVTAQEGQAAQQQTRKTPAMRERVYTVLAEAQACAEMDDFPCAMENLADVRAMDDLNSYEVAQMWNFYAFIYYAQDRLEDALEAYVNVLEQPDLPIGMETDTIYTVAQLYQATERYPEALEMLDRWFAVAVNPGPQPYYLKAVIHYQLEQYRQGIEPITAAINLAEERGEDPQEGWYQLLNVFYFELEDFPNVIRTLTTMVELWPKREHLTQLAGIYGQEGDDERQLLLWEAAYEAGWLERGTEFVSLAQMLLAAGAPYKAAVILEEGLDSGQIESTMTNWRTLAQSWQMAQEDERALPAYARASSLADDGELDMRLAQSYANLARWDECVESARTALNRGGVSRTDQLNLLLGNCLVEERRYGEALEVFRAAARDDRSRSSANQWIAFVQGEQRRERELDAMLSRG
ncbi:MAG: tetratricopeptide repeat protein [Gammaproteobacteria bacterium]